VKNIQSVYSHVDDEFSITITGDIEGDGPTDVQVLKVIDHLLSSLPGCNNTVKGVSRKDVIMGKWVAFRELGS
jgi:hypothetical protein